MFEKVINNEDNNGEHKSYQFPVPFNSHGNNIFI